LVHNDGRQKEIAEEAFVASVAVDQKQEVVEEVAPAESPKQEPEKQVQPAPTAVPKPKIMPQVQAKVQTSSPLPSKVVPTSTSTPVLAPAPLPLPPSPDPAPQPSPVSAQVPLEKININTANLEELDQITGVGPAIAQRIIDYRNTNGMFYQIEDLKNVDGIGDVNFEKMRDEITVGDVVAPPSIPPPGPVLESSPPPPPPQAPEPEKININTADVATLDLLPGVGPAIANNIIGYRTEHGLFQSIEEIKNVSGIGDAKFEGMKDQITI